MTRRAAATLALTLASGVPAYAQTAALELVQSVGTSSESISAAATQVRASGEPVRGLRISAEGSWGTRSRGGSDAFGTAYPYGDTVDVIEAWAEYSPRRRFGLQSVRAGRYRTPFGASAASDHAYIGFLRAPLIRYGDYFALSSGYLEHGVDVVVGAPRLSVELSVGKPADVGEAIRRDGTNTVIHAQGVAGDLIVGGSFIDTMPYLPSRFAKGRARFGGIDVRWMKSGVQLRGEWLGGRPFNGTSTTGGYVDAIVHSRSMGPVTALARAETLDYNTTSRFALHTSRVTGGLRVRVWQGLGISAGLVHQAGQLTQRRRTALDLGATWALRKNYGAR